MAKAWNTISKLRSLPGKLLLTARMLSIDILFGVVSSYVFAGSVMNSNAPLIVPVFLCLAVWLVYTFDHLADAAWLAENSIKPVYQWHRKNRKTLVVIIFVFMIGGGVVSILLLPSEVILTGFFGVGVLLLYYLIHTLPIFRNWYFFKEFWIALIYTAGIWVFPIFFSKVEMKFPQLIIITAFFSLVLVNVLGYSYFEHSSDQRQGLKTLPVFYGIQLCRLIIRILLVFSVILLSFWLFLVTGKHGAGWILMLMAGLLGMIHLFPSYFEKKERFGIFSDLIFFLPAGILVF